MAKIGLSLKIDVTKIDKAQLYQGKKGKWLDAQIFVDLDNKGEYGDNGMVTQTGKNIEKGKGAILGNGTIFWRDDSQPQQQAPGQAQPPSKEPEIDFDDDVPF